eukprot:CAMPEP_0176482364 /NCGR_PEP_ID=MMETSP0200_2-20121128/3334_1 /TAXON_ID=947934 /ORGANISM="Chaetoceros sp., Strain GSL56" /LENGTH=389 /DNA_ID=CAMNT_0017878671 /DNA_START=187 /DNA_END=1356 /DNA_ORIENTATION=+
MAITGQSTPPPTMPVNSTPGGTLFPSAQKPRQNTGNRYNGGQLVNSYTVIKATSEGGDKRMLDVIFERLKYTIQAEWATGKEVAKILDTGEDVTVAPPARLTTDQKKDDLHFAIWREKVKQHVLKLDALEDAKSKLFSTVWKLLSKIMQSKVAGQSGFSEKSETSDVVWLVKTVRSLVTDFDSAMPEILSVSEALERIITYRQPEKMDNAEYVRVLLSLIKVYGQYCGAYGVHLKAEKCINDDIAALVDEDGDPLTDDVRSTKRQESIRMYREKAIAMQIIRGACRKRYSSLRRNLATDFGLKTNKYPETIDDAVNALNVAEKQLSLPFKKLRNQDDLTFAQNGHGNPVAGTNGKIIDNIICHKCKKSGHYANKCPMESQDEVNADEEP